MPCFMGFLLLFLDLKFGYGIVYAIQNSESVDFRAAVYFYCANLVL